MTPADLSRLADLAARARTHDPDGGMRSISMSGSYADLSAACAPEAVAALVAVAQAARDVSCCAYSDCDGSNCRPELDAALARLDACAAGRIA